MKSKAQILSSVVHVCFSLLGCADKSLLYCILLNPGFLERSLLIVVDEMNSISLTIFFFNGLEISPLKKKIVSLQLRCISILLY